MRIRLALLLAAAAGCAPARPALPDDAVRLVLIRGKEGECGCERVAEGATVVGCFAVDLRTWRVDAEGRMADAYRADPRTRAALQLMFMDAGPRHPEVPAGTRVVACALR